MKLYELIHEGRVSDAQLDKEFEVAHSRRPTDFTIMINGKIWKRKGEPVLFKDHAAALKIANKITTDRNITTQVVPLKKGP